MRRSPPDNQTSQRDARWRTKGDSFDDRDFFALLGRHDILAPRGQAQARQHATRLSLEHFPAFLLSTARLSSTFETLTSRHLLELIR